MAKLGWIGMGNIGTPMALRMIDAGHEIMVWGRTRERLKPALDKGAADGASAAQLAAECDAVFLCISDTRAVEEVVFGPHGIASCGAPGKLVIDNSTINPQRTRELAKRLRDEHGMGWLDAPVSGGAIGAAAGKLACLVGGAAADFAQARPWIAAFASNITHMGDNGTGQVAKSCNQAVLTATLAVWGEVLEYAESNGLDPSRLVEALADSWSDSAVRRVHAPNMALKKYPKAKPTLMLKDLDILADTARATKSPMPISALVMNLYRQQLALGFETGGIIGFRQLYAGAAAEE
ncbi:MAG: NAD(P)-dependent oxidoreductase [Rhodospirillales bacterium]|nr:NAD(P)-dependent oxidoreductase [Rhodospirillales bacterium]